MKNFSFVSCCGLSAAFLLAMPVHAQTRGVDVKGADVVGSDVQGGSVTGGSVTGGSVTGGSVTGGSVTGGSVSGGTVTPGTVTPGTVTAMADGREIQVRAVGAVSVNVNGATAEVKLDNQTLLIEKTRLVLDGKEIGSLPPTSNNVLVEVTNGQLTVKSGGKHVTKAKLN